MTQIGNYSTYIPKSNINAANRKKNWVKPILMLLFDTSFWKTIWELIFIWYVKRYRKYYTHIEYLPLDNFSEIMKGKFKYLYHKPKNRRAPRIYFAMLFQEMNYQFHTLDNSNLRDKADLADYHSKYTRTRNKRWLNEYNTLKKKIKDREHTVFNLDAFTDYIEQTFNFAPGTINPKTISTAKAFNNHQRAVEYNKNRK